LNLSEIGSLEFRELDPVRFPAVGLAKSTVVAGGAMSAVFSVANEVAVGAFLGGGLSFLRIVPMIEEALARFSGSTYTDLTSLQGLVDEVSGWVEEQCRLSGR
ncbi:MAG: hypothetical protein RL417_481, partial [Pseudomonadota bacterium]